MTAPSSTQLCLPKNVLETFESQIPTSEKTSGVFITPQLYYIYSAKVLEIRYSGTCIAFFRPQDIINEELDFQAISHITILDKVILVIVVKSSDAFWGIGFLDVFSLKILYVQRRDNSEFNCMGVSIPSILSSSESHGLARHQYPIIIGVDNGNIVLFKLIYNMEELPNFSIVEVGEIRTQTASPITYASVFLASQQDQGFFACGFENGQINIYSCDNSNPDKQMVSDSQLLLRLRSPTDYRRDSDNPKPQFEYLEFINLFETSEHGGFCLHLVMSFHTAHKDLDNQATPAMFIAQIEPISREYSYSEIRFPSSAARRLLAFKMGHKPDKVLFAAALNENSSEVQILQYHIERQTLEGSLYLAELSFTSENLLDFYFDESDQKIHLLFSESHSSQDRYSLNPTPTVLFEDSSPFRLRYMDWFFTDIRRTPYTQQELTRLSMIRQKVGGRLYVDFLVENSHLPEEYVYPIQTVAQMEALVSLCSKGEFLVEKSCLLYYLARDCIHDKARLASFAKLIHLAPKILLRLDGYWSFDHASSAKTSDFIIPQNEICEGVQVENMIDPINFSSVIWQSWNVSLNLPLPPMVVFLALLRVDIFLAHLFRKLFIKEEEALKTSLLELCKFSLSERKRSRVLLDIVPDSKDEEVVLAFLMNSQKPMLRHFCIVWLLLRNKLPEAMDVFSKSQTILNHSYDVSRLTELKLLLQLVERFTSISRPNSAIGSPFTNERNISLF